MRGECTCYLSLACALDQGYRRQHDPAIVVHKACKAAMLFAADRVHWRTRCVHTHSQYDVQLTPPQRKTSSKVSSHLHDLRSLHPQISSRLSSCIITFRSRSLSGGCYIPEGCAHQLEPQYVLHAHGHSRVVILVEELSQMNTSSLVRWATHPPATRGSSIVVPLLASRMATLS